MISNTLNATLILPPQQPDLIQHLSLSLALLQAEVVPDRGRDQRYREGFVVFRREDFVCVGWLEVDVERDGRVRG